MPWTPAKAAMILDDCELWIIEGKRGYISSWGDGETFLIYVGCRSSKHWIATKKRLEFCKVTQDGDEEGCLRLFELPTANQAQSLRKALQIHQRKPPPVNAYETRPATR
jgi:hypothetical protein